MANGQTQDLSDRIRKYILNSCRKPGERIETEHELAALFKVTRYQIRNMLSGLVQQGILSKAPRRGTVINHFDPAIIADNLNFAYQISNSNLYEYMEARMVVELAAMPLIIKRITPVKIAEAEEIIGRMIRLRNDPPRADQADRDFHLLLLGSCGNQLLASFSAVISGLFHYTEYRRQYWSPSTITRLAEEHRRIIEAIKLGDAALAVSRMENHLHYRQKIEKISTAPSG
jgi:GntR family transcriptional regulator, transcriptional repressor for pyruvate dehydrogenase complex